MTFFHLGKRLADLSHSEQICNVFIGLEQMCDIHADLVQSFNGNFIRLSEQLDNLEIDLDSRLDSEFGFPDCEEYLLLPVVDVRFPVFGTRHPVETTKSVIDVAFKHIFYETRLGEFYWDAMLGLDTPELSAALSRKLHELLGPIEDSTRDLNRLCNDETEAI